MEIDLSIEASFTNETSKLNVIKLFENLIEAVGIIDEEVDKDDSNPYNCFQVGMPQASRLASNFIEDVSNYLGEEWLAAKKADVDVVANIARGLEGATPNENILYIEFFISGYDLEIVELLYPLLIKLGAETVSASSTYDEDPDEVLEYECKDNKVSYKNIDE